MFYMEKLERLSLLMELEARGLRSRMSESEVEDLREIMIYNRQLKEGDEFVEGYEEEVARKSSEDERPLEFSDEHREPSVDYLELWTLPPYDLAAAIDSYS